MNRIKLKNKLISFVLLVVVLIMIVSTVIVSIIVSKQNRDASNDVLRRAFKIIHDDISGMQDDLLFHSRYITTEGNKGSHIKFLNMYKTNPDYDITRDSYFEIVQNLYSVALAGGLRKVSIYDFEGDITAFVAIDNKEVLLGFPNWVPGGLEYKTASLKTGGKLRNDLWKSTETAPGIQPRFPGEMFQYPVIRFEYIDNLISLVSYSPVMGQVFNRKTREMEPKQMGIAVAVRALDKVFVSRISEYTGALVNIFSAKGLSTGTLTSYKTFDPGRVNPSKGKWRIADQKVIFNEINIGDAGYFEGVLHINSDSGWIGAISVLHSKEVAKANTLQMIKMLSVAAVACILIILPIVIWISRSVIRPITNLADKAYYISKHRDLDQLIEVQSNDELGVLSLAFNSMIKSLKDFYEEMREKNLELQRMDGLKDEFLANTSHELRTPLNGIIGIAGSMIDGAAGTLTREQRYNLSLIVLSGHRLANLINDILDFSKLKHHDLQLQIKPLDIRSVAEVVLMLSRALTGSKDLQLVNRIEPDVPAVDADENRVQQIMYNLVGNAVKFTETGTVSVSARPREGYLAITVSDTGIGISGEKAGAIFESFEQADGSASRKYGGTGLGLAITRQLVELHSGEIRVESKLGKGSDFIFTLPISKSKPEPSQLFNITCENHNVITGTALKPEEDLYNEILEKAGDSNAPTDYLFRILIADDEPVNLRVLKNYLSLQHYSITQATNGHEALAAIESGNRFNLVLLDIMMPEMSGYEVCRKIRETYSSNELPVIMMTAKNRVSDLVQGFESGANDYIIKPFSKDELMVRVLNHLRLSEASNALKKASERVETANRVRSAFIANMNHEIRTPINAIIGFAEILEGQVKDEQKEYLLSIISSGKILLTLLNDVLDLSKIESGKLELQNEEVDLRVLFNEIKNIFSVKTRKKGLDFQIEIDPALPERILSDKVRLRQILFNLVGNAVKYTDSGLVKLVAQRDPESEELVISVQDTGIGIPEDHEGRVFEAFIQYDQKNIGRYGGAGLGLAIAKRLVKMMGGKISLESTLGKRSVFQVMLGNVAVASAADSSVDIGTGKDTFHAVYEDAAYESQLTEIKIKSPELVHILENEITDKWSRVKTTFYFNEIEEFANEIKELGKKYDSDILVNWGDDLYRQAKCFDMERLPGTLDYFYEIIKKFL
ncbi:MAG: response regulator [Desulfobacteraceae bacterium]|nr:response regulator [Desulfobacteraceae bacterium]